MGAPVAKLDSAAKWHPSTDVAAAEVFKNFSPKLKGLEQAGVLYANGQGQHSYSAPVTQSERDGFALSAQVQPGHTISGIYHNHPGSDSLGQYFSPNDIEVANKLKVPSYVQFEDGSIRKYVPGQTKTESIKDGWLTKTVARGDPVILPDDSEPVDAKPDFTPLAGATPPNPMAGLTPPPQQ